MQNKKKERNYNREYEVEKLKKARISIKVDKKYNYMMEQIKEDYKNKGGMTKFITESIKNYNNKELILTVDETAHLMAIIENYLQKYNDLEVKYLKEVQQLEEKIKIYYDDIFKIGG